MTMYPRLRMRLELAERGLPIAAWTARPLSRSDVPALGALMLSAYRGTVDDEGESEADAIAEVERTLAGEYGPLLPDCSFAVDEGDRLVASSLVTLWEGDPFLAYLVVHPEMQRRGLGTCLTAVSAEALASAGYSALELFVTEANEPAVNLYRTLGFRVVDRIARPPTGP